MNIAKSTGKIAVAKIGNSLLTFIGITYFARLLGPEGVGVFFLFQATMGMGALVSDLGIQGAVEKRLSEEQSAEEILTTGLLLKTGLLLLLVAPILLFQDNINQYLGADLAILLIIGISIQSFSTLTIKIINAELRVGETAFIRLSRQITWIVVGVVLANMGYGVVSLVYGLLAGLFISFLWAVHVATTPFGQPNIASVKSIFDYSKYNFVASASWRFHNWADVAIIGIFLSSSFVGVYEIAWKVSVFATFFINAITTTIFPQISSWEAAGDYEKIESLIPEILLWSFLLVIPAFFGTLVFSREILTLIYGTEYGTASLVLIILMGEKIVQAIYRPLKRILEGIDHVDLAAKATLAGIVSNVILNIALVQWVGVIGAAIATSLSLCIMVAAVIRYLRKFINIEVPSTEIIWLTGSSAVMAGILMIIKSYKQPSSIPELVVMVAIGALLYFTFLSVNNSFRSDMKEISKQVIT